MLKQPQINELFNILSQNISLAETELKFHNNFTLLIAVVLSAQSKDSSVNIATKDLFKIIKTPEDILKLGEEKLIDYIKTIGLYRNKAKNIISLSKSLIENFNSEVPENFEDLISLAGVGRKTANVILNVAFGKPTMPVDTHVFRLARRIGLSKGKNVEQVEEDLLKKMPKGNEVIAHHLLILHGRYTCKAKGFDCLECVINHICEKNL